VSNCLERHFFSRPTVKVAKDLVGMKIVRRLDRGGIAERLSGTIVETEAYGGPEDEASHARMGPTARNAVMFGQVGRAYVYFTYGTHFCVNISARTLRQKAGAVLIRAIEPLEGVEAMKLHRTCTELHSLASGPGKLTQAMKIGLDLNGADMTDPRSALFIERGISGKSVVSTPRIGISRATEKRWRFIDPSSTSISRKARINVR
jgi:DNA-3-methyladenine glycosylase